MNLTKNLMSRTVVWFFLPFDSPLGEHGKAPSHHFHPALTPSATAPCCALFVLVFAVYLPIRWLLRTTSPHLILTRGNITSRINRAWCRGGGVAHSIRVAIGYFYLVTVPSHFQSFGARRAILSCRGSERRLRKYAR